MVFTPEEVESLNAYQISGAFHPFTCGGDRTDKDHHDGGVLIAAKDGWYCPFCEFRQQAWCHQWMKE